MWVDGCGCVSDCKVQEVLRHQRRPTPRFHPEE